ncbi:oxidase EvaA [Actinomadura pelletieri DSM 43383]|uniref:Oxidase EvaA n=1 Tax=Actinomadura pelletieri DSM 43383 TaxID=1120940 RepID=A0A495Q9L2_9ACTN|nr:NDP-hexose 2,3-dehydratase family protein [Actinomadura pelletieri]RKS68183.1 oxidase EvaA [Actinomadura pelletieri DSM 43383]
MNVGEPATVGGGRTRLPAEFGDWWAERRAAHRFEVTGIPFEELDGWRFEPGGNLVHESGRFFTVEGLRVRGEDGSGWDQPILHQPEIGILGLLVKDVCGVPHCLMQAKMEPGNVNGLQLSPTVQATRSNYTRVHGGGRTRYLEHFWGPRRGRVLVDVLQSEQGAWFWQKHNRNMIVEVDGDVPEHPDFRWLPLPEVLRLLSVEDLVNMDSRTVLGCLPRDLLPAWSLARADLGSVDAFGAALRRSYGAAGRPLSAVTSQRELETWLLDAKSRGRWETRLIPLSEASGCDRDRDAITVGDVPFRIIAVRVRAGSREVTQWSQPMLEPHEQRRAAFLARSTRGILHLLVQARFEPGLLAKVELAPTVLLPSPDALAGPAPFLHQVVSADPARIRFDASLSEEGGRFYHARTRYQVIEVGEDFPLEVPESHAWMTVHQLMELVRHGQYLNVEARTLLACLHGLT